MRKLYRIIDANINRVAEGLRVLEDISRFYSNNSLITEKVKSLRHNVRKVVAKIQVLLLSERDSLNDLGLEISQKTDWDNKTNLQQLILANFKRVEEGLRVIEETLKVAGEYELSKIYESYRYESYALEKEFLLQFGNLGKRARLCTDLYCLTSEEHSNGRDNIEVVREMIAAGIKIIQYREKEKTMLEKYRECEKIRDLTQDITFLVNDHLDLALAVEADGVHLGQDDLPIQKVRELVGEEMIIGISTHSPEQAEKAVVGGADYIGVGPIFSTKTKKDVCDPVGLTYLDYVVKNIKIPFVAIGGIKENNILQVVKRGAKTVAMVTEIVGAENIPAKITSIRRKIQDELHHPDGCS